MRSRTTKPPFFEALCDMYNSFDASISVQLSLISRHANKEDFKSSITIAPQNDSFIDVIVDGPYVEELRDVKLHWKGSKNQRVIDAYLGVADDA